MKKTESELINEIVEKLKDDMFSPCYLSVAERKTALKWMEYAQILSNCNTSDKEVRITWS